MQTPVHGRLAKTRMRSLDNIPKPKPKEVEMSHKGKKKKNGQVG